MGRRKTSATDSQSDQSAFGLHTLQMWREAPDEIHEQSPLLPAFDHV